MTPVRISVGLCLGFISVVVGLFVFSVTRTPLLSEQALREQGVFLLPQPREITPFELSSHRGAPFTLDDLQGSWTFAFFGFTNCPDVCPTSMAVLGQADALLKEQPIAQGAPFQGLLISVDPQRDDARMLERYVKAFSPDFKGATGALGTLATLAREVSATFMKVPELDENGEIRNDSYQVDHTTHIVIINPRGHYHGFVKYPAQAATIAAAYRTLAAHF